MTRLIRGAGEADFDAVLALEQTAWPSEKGTYINDPWFRWDQFRIALVDGRIVSMLKILRREMAAPNGTVMLGGIGSVTTHPDFRRQGHSGALLQDAVAYMEQNGYELSMLFTGLPDFYAKCGWRVAPLPKYRIALTEGMIGRPQNLELRRFDLEKDIAAVDKVYRAYNQRRMGVLVRSRDYWRMQQIWTTEDKEAFALVLHDGNVAGYLRGGARGDEFVVRECAYVEPAGECVKALASHAIDYARKKECSVLLLSVPTDSALLGAFRALGLEVEEQAYDSMMLRLIDREAVASRFGCEAVCSTEEFIAQVPEFYFWHSDGF